MKRIIFSLCIMACALSCDSDNDAEPISPPQSNFYALTVGNSWVYKNYKYDASTETYEDTGVIDSVSIVGTETISGNTYFKFRRLTTGNDTNITFCNANGEHFEWLRDSLGNLTNEQGKVKFTNSDFSERLIQENSWGNMYEVLQSGNASMSLDSGTFNCVTSERYLRNTDGEQQLGLDMFYYADGIGLIYDTSSFVTNPIHSIERRLDAYNVQ